MNRTKLSIVSLFILLQLCAAHQSYADSPLADRVPGDAVVYVGWAGSASPGPQYDSSHLKAVLDASAFPQLFNESVPRLIQKISQQQPQVAPILHLITAVGGPLWRHPSALYFGGVDFTGAAPSPHIALLCDAGDEAAPLLARFTELLAQVHPTGVPIIAKQYGSLVVLTTIDSAATDALFSKPLDAPLSKSPAFIAACDQVQHDSVAIVYADLQGIVKLVGDGVQKSNDPQSIAMWPKIEGALNLTGVRQAIWTAGFDGADWSNQSFIGSDGSKTGVPGLLNAPPLDDDLLSLVPQSANRVIAGQIDLGGIVQAIRNAIQQFDPETAQQFDQFFAQANAMLGVDLQKDLLDPLGNQWLLYTDRAVGGPGLLGMVVVNKLKDAAKVDAALTAISSRANTFIAQGMNQPEITLEFRQTTIDGNNIHYFAIPFVTPGWAVKDGNLYVGLYPQVIASAITFAQSKGPSILQNPQYLALQHRLGDHKAAALSYFDLPAMAGDGYGDLLLLSRMYLGAADMFGAQTPPMVLPPLDKVLPELSASESIEWSDDAGAHTKDISPFPGSQALVGGSPPSVGQDALLASILLPSLNRARETANRVKCASNERQIGQAILLYANDNQGKYPPDLGTLLKTEDITAEVFVCPSGNNEVPPDLKTPDQLAQWVNEHSDYIYIGKGQTSSINAQRIVVYEKPDAHGNDGMNILYGDGHVEFQTMIAAKQAIDQQENAGQHGL